MKCFYLWSDDGEPEVCDYETVTPIQDVPCTHCDNLILSGGECVKLTAADGIVYWLHDDCAKQGTSFIRPELLHKLKQWYLKAQNVPPGMALQAAMLAESDEERSFFAYIADMNLQRLQWEAIRQEAGGYLDDDTG